PCLDGAGDAVVLKADTVDIDVLSFERLARAGNPEALVEAVRLYRGDFLEGLAFRGGVFEDWLIAEREALHELALEALAKLLAHQRAIGAVEAALATALRLATLDPLQEATHRILMRLYVELGRRGTALRQYQICVDALKRELGVEPEPETRVLYQEILRQRAVTHSHTPSSPVARPVVSEPRFAWPTGDRPLVGREAELARLRTSLGAAFRFQLRTVAVVGEAGIGKTSLLGHLAAEATTRGARVLLGRCYESVSILPFGPWVDAFRSSQVLDDEALLDTLPPIWRSELARLLPELDRA